ncbi:pantetheine-phosphate adenylyltransferase [Herbivorax sp. ANBcel31]|uniref:pantetheine-phosphate adenylyltransferase n=1 Tax=Herbivorax sp. ANBcel31 TaxID=3069754 RepID=UPI0027AF8C75|nr:pantetheine-phosphate adenylyltransferase [Herbivorax sp. ANBcel31]MDQ2085031.1 pantetheine-phosphate adenylyltransferase [Herbivorax sp. ANBcel31]
MSIYVYPGSFDPITNGHLDIIQRASKLCDKLIVAVLVNNNKKPAFSLEERVELLRCAVKDVDNVEIESFTGLLIDFMKNKNASVIIKGLRAVSDFEYELQMALLNKKLDLNVETLFMMTNINYSFLSSSSVKELAKNNGSIDGLVPCCIKDKVLEKFKK